MSVDDRLEKIRLATEVKLKEIQKQANDLIEKTIDDSIRVRKRIVHQAGFFWCNNCNGTGAIERLDNGYMRRFGLQEWNGCKNCGGDGNKKRGKGYTEAIRE